MKTTLALLLAIAIGAILAIGALTARGRQGGEDAPRSAAGTLSPAEESSTGDPANGGETGSGSGSGSPSSVVFARGVHARAGVECADCHVAGFAPDSLGIEAPEAADRSSPLELAARACAPCHGPNVNLVVAEARATQERTRTLLARAESAVAAYTAAAREAEMRAGGAARLTEARALGMRAQTALTLVRGDGSFGVHAPQEVARLLAEAIDDARLAQAKVVAAGGVVGVGAAAGGRREAARRGTAADSVPGDSAKPTFELPAVTP